MGTKNSRTWPEQQIFTLSCFRCHPVGSSLQAVKSLKGDCLSVEPVKRQTLLGLLAGWDALEDELPEIEDTAPEPVGL